jgi:hypothetical protein
MVNNTKNLINTKKVYTRQYLVKTSYGLLMLQQRQDTFYDNSAHEDSSLLPSDTESSRNPRRLVQHDDGSTMILQNTKNHSPSVTASVPEDLNLQQRCCENLKIHYSAHF